MSRRTQTLWVALTGVIAVATYAALAAVSILILNPLAAVPGLTLAEITSEMNAAGESLGEAVTLIILGIGVMLAIVVAVIAVRSRPHPAVPALCFLGLIAFGGLGYFIASFGAGMALADTFYISGAPHLPAVLAFYAVSAMAAALLAAGIIYAVLRTRQSAPA